MVPLVALANRVWCSPIRRKHDQRATLVGLGLNRIGLVSELPDTPQTRGMLVKVKHLVRVHGEQS